MHVPFPVTLAANAAIGAIVRSNPEAKLLLSESQGGLVAIELQNPSLSLRLSIQADGVELLSVYEDKPDLQLTADLPSLMALAEASHDPILEGRVQAVGDMALAKLVQQLGVALTVDWEGQLAPFIGDALAHKIGTAARGLAAWGAETRQRGGEDVGEYLQEEARLLVTRSEWRELEQSSDTVRERLDRLIARVQQVKL